MVFNAKLDQVSVEVVVSTMVEINPSTEAWASATLGKTDLWFQLARKFIVRADKHYAHCLKIRFDRNRNNLKVMSNICAFIKLFTF